MPPNFLTNSFISVEPESEAPGMRARALSPETSKGLESPSQPVPLGSTRASGRATTGSTPSVLNASAVRMTPKSYPASSGAEPTKKTLSPGSLETDDMLLPQAPSALGSGKESSRTSGLCGTTPAPTSATLNTNHPRRRWLSSTAPPASIVPVHRSGLLHSPWHAFSPGAQKPSAWRAGHSKPKTFPIVTLRNKPAVTKPLPSIAPERSELGLTSLPDTMGSGSPRDTVASGLGTGPSSASTLLLPSAVAPPQPPSPFFSLQPSPTLSLFSSLPPSPVLVPVSSVVTGTSDSPDPSVSAFTPSTTDLPLKTSSLAPVLPSLMALQPATVQGTVHSWSGGPSSLAPLTTLSLQHSSSLPSAPPVSGSSSIPGGTNPTQSSVLSHPGQDASLQNLDFSDPGHNHITRTVTFRIASEHFSAATWRLTHLEHKLLGELLRYRLQLIFRKAFPSFENVSALLLQPGSVDVNASLVFGQPGPSACEVLWALYRKVRASRWLLGHLSVVENSLASDGFNLTDLALETVSINFTVMRPFLPQLHLPGSHPFVLLEEQILQLVTPEVSVFYKMHPQQGPLLLFSNANQWVSVYMEYKFQSPLPSHLQGLASHLAHHITDPILQKSSIVANGEKAELALYEMRLLILDRPFTKALENKTSPEFQELRGQLTKWLTSVLRPLQNFGQVVVEEFQLEPMIAKMHAVFWGAAPAQSLIQACVRQALGFLQEVEGLQAEMFNPNHGTPSSGVSSNPSYALVVNLLLVTSILVLVVLHAAPPFTKTQTPHFFLLTSLHQRLPHSASTLRSEDSRDQSREAKTLAQDCAARGLLPS